MKESDKKQIRLWIETWKKAGAALEEIRRRELESSDYGKNQDIIDNMLQFACENRKPRLTSGLVEQQRWFMKMREKLRKEADESSS